MKQLEEFTKKFVDALYTGTFGVVFSREKTRIKQIKIQESEEVIITCKDPIDKKLGIQILFDYKKQGYEIKFRGKIYKSLAEKIEKYFRKNKIINGKIEEI